MFRKTNDSGKTSLSEKLGFLLTNIGNIPLMTLLSTYFMFFYTEIVGLRPGAIATLFLISKIVDAISDPFMGYLLDRAPVTRYGKFRPLLIIGTVICVINYILLWFGAVWSPTAKYFIVYATYLLLGITFDIMDISLNSLIPVMTTDSEDRSRLSSIKNFGYAFGSILLSIVGPLIVASDTLQSYYVLIFGAMVVVLVCSIVGALFIHERTILASHATSEYNLREMLSFFLTQPVLVVFISRLLNDALYGCSSGADTYYYTYILGDLGIMSKVAVINMAVMIPVTFLTPTLIHKAGKEKVYVTGLLLKTLGFSIRFFAPTLLGPLYIGTVIKAFGETLGSIAGIAILADVTTYIQYTFRKHAEAAVASLSSFITKCGQGISGALPGYILELTGYTANATVQTSCAKAGIIAADILIPLIGCLLAAIIFAKFYTLDEKKMREMTLEIHEREEKRSYLRKETDSEK